VSDSPLELSVADELVLGGVLRFATRFDGLDAEARRTALTAAGTELGYRAAETRRVVSERAGYRDAAMVVQVVSTDFARLITRADGAFVNDRALRDAIASLTRPQAQLAIVRAVETLVSHSGVTRKEELFLDWLRATWRIPPPVD
jgi:hypothetical protein